MSQLDQNGTQNGSLSIGTVTLSGKAILAPMSGVTDYPFRKLAHQWGAPMVVSEMVASHSLMLEDADTMRRTVGYHLSPFVVQLAGREAHWMGQAASMAQDLGADIIDINMGCPAKQVTKGLSGSALMKDLDHAISLIKAVVRAVQVPVTLKMRLGWDQETINAPELAMRAEAEGVQAFTVHGRTRQQFYKGQADWSRIKAVKAVVKKPVFVNGDIKTIEDANNALAQSSADGVMIGRGAYGAPWRPAQISKQLAGQSFSLKVDKIKTTVLSHYELMLSHYGKEFGLKAARKHLGWYVESLEADPIAQQRWRQNLCTADNVPLVMQHLNSFFNERVDQTL